MTNKLKNNSVYKSHEVKLTVPFHDIDLMQVVWHGNYFKYFDNARFALFKDSGIDLLDYFLNKYYAFPIVKSSIKYITSLRFQDEFICKATITEIRHKIAMDFEIRLANSDTVCTKGKSEQVAIKVPEMKIQYTIPDDIQKAMIVN